MQSSGKIKLVDLNPLLTCVLCKGYYIDATTIIECLHSFCKTCIVRYLQSNKFCPTCDVQVHKTRPLLNIRSDQTLQDIVYKLVPGLFKNEMKRRRDFYRQDDALVQKSIPSSSEKRGDIWGCDRLIFTPEDIISVSLEYSPLSSNSPRVSSNLFSLESFHVNGDINKKRKKCAKSDRRYLRCPGGLKVHHLKKLLRAKYGLLNSDKKVDLLYMHDVLKDEFTLVDLAYIYAWKRSEPLRLFYKITEKSNIIVQNIENSNIIEAFANTVALENQVPLVVSTASTSTCTIPIASLAPSVATAPSSRHPSPPPSPQMAQEPNYFRVANQNAAILHRGQDATLPEPKLKSALKKTSSFNSSESPPILRNLDNDVPEFASKSQLEKGILTNCKTPNDLKLKKRVTFSVNLVQDCQTNNNSMKRKAPKYPGHRGLYKHDPVNASTINKVYHSKNKVLSRKSS
ncbi:polycomb complex protein BMI-1-like [Argiope bruennichi]|uniref:Polycomb complex protein BMI-1 like protein n=1 Tax=Argiope bruennichi TaxID=94029 RepID=A0A8T0FXJ7_ARGBR|nr:polycomb complex protein BMI-1-like [Argiope bruennichi]KAF8794320.1 Polycomb complex protein BMI-1 like protein [Argiope bruennichi]